jgi:LacI family transcriptional regulator
MQRVKKIILILAGSSYHCREIARGVYDYSARHARWDIFFEAAVSPECCAAARHAIKDWGVDGAIGQLADEGLLRAIKDAELPSVNVSDRAPAVPSVKSDSSMIAAMAAKYFLDKGLKSLGYCCTGDQYSLRINHYFGLVAKRYGASCNDILMGDPGRWLDRQDRIQHWLQELPKPVGILAPLDYLGRKLTLLCRHLNIHVPEEVAIMGVNNDDLECSLSIPPLSSVVTAGRQIGHEAAVLLDGMLCRRRRPPSKPILLPPLGIADRQSTDITRVTDPEIAAAVSFIRGHASEPISVADVMKVAPLSRSALDQRFLRMVGRTPKAEILRARIALARSLLSDSDNAEAKLTQIAVRSGFTHYSRFCELFAKETGMTPAEYRHRLFCRD